MYVCVISVAQEKNNMQNNIFRSFILVMIKPKTQHTEINLIGYYRMNLSYMTLYQFNIIYLGIRVPTANHTKHHYQSSM
jgi:hypothetical protein